jgi:undecaprenyl-diphosphatase
VSLAVAVGALSLFAWLADEVLRGQTRQFDAQARAFVNGLATPALTRAMINVTLLGSIYFLLAATACAIVAFLAIGWPRAAGWMAIAMAGVLVLDSSLKYSFHRQRTAPFFGVMLPHSPSFPSGHAMGSFCFYGVLAGLLMARVRSRGAAALIFVVATVVIAAIGFSRVYLGVHYPTDVVAGYLAAAVWVSGLVAADRYRTRRATRKN